MRDGCTVGEVKKVIWDLTALQSVSSVAVVNKCPNVARLEMMHVTDTVERARLNPFTLHYITVEASCFFMCAQIIFKNIFFFNFYVKLCHVFSSSMEVVWSKCCSAATRACPGLSACPCHWTLPRASPTSTRRESSTETSPPRTCSSESATATPGVRSTPSSQTLVWPRRYQIRQTSGCLRPDRPTGWPPSV